MHGPVCGPHGPVRGRGSSGMASALLSGCAFHSRGPPSSNRSARTTDGSADRGPRELKVEPVSETGPFSYYRSIKYAFCQDFTRFLINQTYVSRSALSARSINNVMAFANG